MNLSNVSRSELHRLVDIHSKAVQPGSAALAAAAKRELERRAADGTDQSIALHDVALQVRQQYGMWRLFPANEAAREFCALMGKKTIDYNDVPTIKALGFTVRTIGEEGKTL